MTEIFAATPLTAYFSVVIRIRCHTSRPDLGLTDPKICRSMKIHVKSGFTFCLKGVRDGGVIKFHVLHIGGIAKFYACSIGRITKYVLTRMSVSSDDCLWHQIATNHGRVTRLGSLSLWEVPHSDHRDHPYTHLICINLHRVKKINFFPIEKLIFLIADLESTRNSTVFSCIIHQNRISGCRSRILTSSANYAN